jgi:radical SAM superfamily enzyme YgiQ (UPF0313 family)
LAKVGAVSPPLNLLLLAAIVRERGYEPSILDCPALGLSYGDAVKRLKEIRPGFVGLTAMTPHIVQAGKLARMIRVELPDTVILLGGAHVSALPEETMRRFPDIDVGFVGEADHSLPEVLEAIDSGAVPSTVKGTISWVSANLVYSGPRTDRVDLDSLPLFAWDILDGFPRIYAAPLFAAHRVPATPILTSRGCPGACIYCYSGCHKTISTYSADYIVNMLLYLRGQYGIKEFMVYDDNFVMFRSNLKRFLNMLIDEKLGFTWSCNARVDMVNQEILDLMARAGCWQISYGIETGNESIMDSLGKRITKQAVVRAVASTRKAGIRTVGYFMIGHFGETLETIEETIQFACETGLDDFRMSFFTPLPGTKASLMVEQFGELENDWGKMNLFSPVFVPQGLTKQQLIDAQKTAIRRFFFRPRVAWSYLKMVRNPLVAARGAYLLSHYIFRG